MPGIVYLLLIILIASATGCGCLIGGGGDTARADRLGYAHKEMEIGVGGPGLNGYLGPYGARLPVAK